MPPNHIIDSMKAIHLFDFMPPTTSEKLSRCFKIIGSLFCSYPKLIFGELPSALYHPPSNHVFQSYFVLYWFPVWFPIILHSSQSQVSAQVVFAVAPVDNIQFEK